MEKINIIASSDNKFIAYLAVMLKSMVFNHKTAEKLNIFILDAGINEKNKGLFLDSFNGDNVIFNFIKIKEHLTKDYAGFNVAYYRLRLGEILPGSIKKIIYLDSDLVFNDDISKLWAIDLKGNIIGACRDFFIKKIKDGIANYHDFGLNPNLDYFNSGLMIINLDLWRKYGVENKCISISKQNKKYLKCWDQYSLNVVLNKHWKKIPQSWNFNAYFFIKNPKVIHYCSPKGKPLDIDYNEPFNRIFFNYLQMTRFNFMKPSINNNAIKRFIFKAAKKILRIK